MISKLLEDIRQQILGDLVLRFGLHQLVEDLLGEEVLALVMKLPAAGEYLLGAPVCTENLNADVVVMKSAQDRV